ncbi:MAG: enoyl-CoA hydratase/isomerase family protein [Magnetovibrio sp.]|nr:enoyl-CoA hydratase/isomerase family protein [Magnetovibrio sp.]
MTERNHTALTFEVADRVATITLNQPERRNALSPEMRDDLLDVVRSIQFDSGLGAVILTGTGGVFCAGGDLKALSGGARVTEEDRQRFYKHHDWFQVLANLEVPVIAAVDGPAYGAGFSLALAADFILVSERARLCCVFPRIGLVPDIGAFFTLPRMVGLQRAKEIMFTGRPLDAAEAKDLGIAMAVHPAEELADAANELAGRLCKGSTAAIGATKRILNQSLHLDAQALIEMEAAAQTVFLSSAYHQDAIARFLDKKPLEYDWERMDRDAG